MRWLIPPRYLPLLVSLFVVLACSRPASALAEGEATPDSLPNDPDLRAATEALARGQPWRATRILAPVLRDSSRRTPEAVLTAARAAAAWGGWAEVDRLLTGAAWLDTLDAGEGHALLARASLERGEDTVALTHARRAAGSGATGAEQGRRLVLLARAYDALERCDSARRAYLDAVPYLPQLADWLRLRAAGATADSAARARAYAALRTEVARARVPWVEARSRERAGDLAGAARAYESLGAPVAALRLRLADSSSATAATRGEVREALLAIVEHRPGSADARAAVALLDSAFTPLTASEELLVARSAARSGPAARAADAFSRALGAGVGTVRDRFTYATILSRLGRDGQAAIQFGHVTAPRALAASAAYQRARSLLRAGKGAAARAALRRVVREHREDAEAASHALYLLADLATDEGRDAAARSAYREVAERYPHATLAARAGFRAAIIALAAGNPRTAARELDALAARYPSSSEALAALYWSGRALSAAGDTAAAANRWRRVNERSPLSYYAMLAARRLGETPWAPPAAPDSFATLPAVDSAMARAAGLERMGMTAEAAAEYDYLAEHAGDSAEVLLATAAAFRAHGLASRAIALTQTAISHGAGQDARVYRLLYPIGEEDALLAEAGGHEIDPALVAALIRQESRFDPHATSDAGARGLMQIMPHVGRRLARALEYPTWDAALLYQPDVSLELGTAHLTSLLAEYSDLGRVLAAYNAGASRVERWSKKHGVDDPELFVERIPYRETRDYVRIVQRNRELYRSLYAWERPAERTTSEAGPR